MFTKNKYLNSHDPDRATHRTIIVMAPYSFKQSNDSNDSIGRFMTDRSRMAPPTKEEYNELFTKYNKGSQTAKQELIERNILFQNFLK